MGRLTDRFVCLLNYSLAWRKWLFLICLRHNCFLKNTYSMLKNEMHEKEGKHMCSLTTFIEAHVSCVNIVQEIPTHKSKFETWKQYIEEIIPFGGTIIFKLQKRQTVFNLLGNQPLKACNQIRRNVELEIYLWHSEERLFHSVIDITFSLRGKKLQGTM